MELSRLSLFGNAAQDSRLLADWRTVPLTYSAGQAVRGAHIDHHEQQLAAAAGLALFQRAADHLLRYHFYPPDVMLHTSDFGLQQRHMRVGDRIVQRIRAVPGLDVLTMNEVTAVNDEPHYAGFTYTTTARHDEIGQWSAQVDWRDDNALVLTIDSVGRAAVPAVLMPIARYIQLRAHRRGIAHFRRLLQS